MSLQIILTDDHKEFRTQFRTFLDKFEEWDVIAEADDGEQAIHLAEQLKPDLIFMDIMMPGRNGIDATHVIHEQFPDIKIIILTIHSSKNYLAQAKKAGASGYLQKSKANLEVGKAIKCVMSGEFYS